MAAARDQPANRAKLSGDYCVCTASASPTIRSFSAALQRRRRSGPDRISVFIATVLKDVLKDTYTGNPHPDTRAPKRRLHLCYSLNVSSYHWLDFLTDLYRDYRGCIVDEMGRTVLLDMEVFEVPHIRDWFRDFCCTQCPPHITPYVRGEAKERVRILATIMRTLSYEERT
jgi:hypothetical protein